MSKDSGYRYYDATSSTLPGPAGRSRSVMNRNTGSDDPVGVVVKVAAGAGDKCVAPASSRPKRRQMLRSYSETEDSLDVPSVQWTSSPLSVSELSTSYQTYCPLLAKVHEDCEDFIRGQVYLVHSCASEQRVSAELKVDGSVVKVSIPIEYNMDVYVAPQDNRSSLAENWPFSQLVEVKKLPLTVRVLRVYQHDPDVDLTGHRLRLLGVEDTAFLRANAINNGWVEQNEVTVIPEFVDVRLSVATGMLGASDDEWTDFISMFSLAVRHVHYFLISSCPEVFSDYPGFLAPGRMSDADDVSLMTSSVSNIRRTCSYYEPSTKSSLAVFDDEQQKQPADDENLPGCVEILSNEQIDIKTTSQVDEGYGSKHSNATKGVFPKSPAPPVSPRTPQAVPPTSVPPVSRRTPQAPLPTSSTPPPVSSRNTQGVIPSSTPPKSPRFTQAVVPISSKTDDTSSQDSGSDLGVNEPARPMPPRRTTEDIKSRRPSPPVSRVKPIVRPTNVHEIQSKQPLNCSSTQNDTPAAAHASSRGPVPVVTPRDHKLNTVDDIPSNLEALSVADVAKCVTLLGLSQKKADMMAKQGVDGKQLVNLTISQLTDELQFTPLDASKLVRFARGWRPT